MQARQSQQMACTCLRKGFANGGIQLPLVAQGHGSEYGQIAVIKVRLKLVHGLRLQVQCPQTRVEARGGLRHRGNVGCIDCAADTLREEIVCPVKGIRISRIDGRRHCAIDPERLTRLHVERVGQIETYVLIGVCAA